MNSTPMHWLQHISEWLEHEQVGCNISLAESIRQASEADLELLVDLIDGRLDACHDLVRIRTLFQLLAGRLVADANQREAPPATFVVPPDSVVRCYDRLSETDLTAAAHALQCLAAQGDVESLNRLADILIEQPPKDWQQVGVALSPLWRMRGLTLQQFLDQLAQAPIQPSTLTVLLDLANHAVRHHRIDGHPWRNHDQQMVKLLQQVVVRLERLQRDPSQYGHNVQQVQQILSDSVAITVSLCDTLGWIGKGDCVSALESAMALAHRHIQTEAAAALARLGEEAGIARLSQLAADPVCRGRVVKYAEELEISGAIDEQYRLPQAIAESELAAWLAQPDRFGIAPQRIEHVETRTLYWPGYERPRDCYLFRFTYEHSAGQLTNIGIAGPVTVAFGSDLTGLPSDDIYAAFAGWHAQHEDIFEVPYSDLNAAQRQEADRLSDYFRRAGFEVQSKIALTFLLDETALLAQLLQNDQPYWGISDCETSVCLPRLHSQTAITAEIVLAIYRGRKLLNAFN